MSTLEQGLYDLGRLDQLAYADTPVHALDPRAKVATTAVFILCVVSFGTYELSAMLPFLAFPLFVAVDANLPLGFIARRLLIVAPFAVLVGAFNPLLDTAIVAHVVGISVSGGWISFLSIVLRFLLTAFAALVLIGTTGLVGVCAALERMGMPEVLSTQLMLLYRNIFLLGEETMRMARARSLRSFGGRGMGWRVYSQMLGSLLLRTVGRAQRIHHAMLARGFDGSVRIVRPLRFTPHDVAFTVGWSLVFVAMRIVNVPAFLGGVLMGPSV
ncbi:MAG: cobalt ECF transporter T component CbiQ [Coriobacteriia bacterium]